MLVAINGTIVGRVFENNLQDGDSLSLFGLVDGG
jgi:sulfur carrier protein ThiS